MSEPSSTVTKLTIEGLQNPWPPYELYDDESLVAHNHLTRYIKDEGECPGCDPHHRMARRVAEAKAGKAVGLPELPEDVSLYLLSVAGSDVSGAALALCRKYMPDVVEAYMESPQESHDDLR